MASIVLVVGGARSGKSDYAQALAQEQAGPRYYLATCPPVAEGDDQELAARVMAHQLNRHGRGWQTVEEGLGIARRLRELPAEATVLVDCLTLWISNLLWADRDQGRLDEAAMASRCQELLAAVRPRQGLVVLVSGEVGCGLVPEPALSRRYRDLVGRCNQVMAAGADRVVQVVCGLPLTIKG